MLGCPTEKERNGLVVNVIVTGQWHNP